LSRPPFALSGTQLGIWLTEQITPGTTAYLNPMGLRLSGPVVPSRVGQALAILQNRHDMLRARIVEVDAEPCQLVEAQAPLPFCYDDAPPGRRRGDDDLVRALLRPLDIERGPMWRALLVRDGDAAYSLYLCLHHLISDGWSVGVLYREFIDTYTRLSAASQPAGQALPPDHSLPAGHALPAASFESILAAGQHRDLAAARRYWQQDQHNAGKGVDLPVFERSRQAAHGVYQYTIIDADQLARLRESCAAMAKSRFILLFTCLIIALYRCTSQRDMSVLIPVSDRLSPGAQAVVGCLLNTVPIRVRIRDFETSASLADQLLAKVTSALTHGLPLMDIVSLASGAAGAGRPHYNVMFLENNAPTGSLLRGGITFTPFEIGCIDVKHDLAVAVSAAGPDVRVRLEYARHRLPAAVAGAVLSELLWSVESLSQDPHARVVQPDRPLEEATD
jgi:hypothetical protein